MSTFKENEMNTKYWFTAILMVSMLITGCGPSEQEFADQVATAVVATVTAIPTATSYPTLTPYPTSTAYPTYTPIPPTATPTQIAPRSVGQTVIGPRWRVRVTKAESGTEFGTFYLTEDATTQMVIITLEYTYLGSESTSFYPESVVLVHTGEERLRGWARNPALYQGQYSSHVVDFTEEVTTQFVNSGDTRTEIFVYSFNKDFTSFLLYFPETTPIVIDID